MRVSAYWGFVEPEGGPPLDGLIRATTNRSKLTGSSKFVDKLENRIVAALLR